MDKYDSRKDIIFRHLSVKELSELYGISTRSLYSQLKCIECLIGKKVGWYYSPKQVEKIFKELGMPPGFSFSRYDRTDGDFIPDQLL
jgi:transposase